MEIQEVTAMPDLFGVPEYRVNKVVYEIDGTDIRMACGVKRFGQIHWLYTVVMTVGGVAIEAIRCEALASDAISMLNVLSKVAH